VRAQVRVAAFVIHVVFVSSCGTAGDERGANISNTNSVDSPSAAISPSPAASDAPVPAVSPTPSLSPLPPDAKGVQAAIDVVEEYYEAINTRNYRKAYQLWSGKGEASMQTFEQFRNGYANTESVEADTSGEPGDLEGAAGSQYVKIPVRLKAKTTGGKVQNFWGEYTLRRSMVDGATAEQRMWRIYSAQFKELP
jgi:hypothetical protein